jgi:Spy/CpxP family protein refolding chaperone
MIKHFRTALLVAAASAAFASIAATPAENPETPPPPHEKQAPAVERHLKNFDTLDFDVFSNQKWDRLHESHRGDLA